MIAIGLVSCLNDLASEMVTPLLPLLLAGSANNVALSLGLIEGVAEALSAFLKLWAGRRSDAAGGKRKPFAIAGYAMSNMVRPLMALASGWGMLLLLRSVDRIGKGIRSAPRDAMLADATDDTNRGVAFGFHRAMDNAGAVGGALLAAAVLASGQFSLPAVIALSALPGAMALAVLALAVKDVPRFPSRKANSPPITFSGLAPACRGLIALIGLMTLARVAETFVILRAHDLGASSLTCLLLWALFNFTKALAAIVGGRFADRFGNLQTLQLSWLLYVVGFISLGLTESLPVWWLVAALYGLVCGFGEGVERSALCETAQAEQLGTAFGWFYLVMGLVSIPAGLGFGWLWQVFGANLAFGMATLVATLASILLFIWRLRTPIGAH